MLRPEAVEYTLSRFEEMLEKAKGSRDSSVAALERRKATLEQQIANCTNAVADGQPSRSLITKLGELERELDSVIEQIGSSQPSAVKSNFRDARRFAEARLRDLRKLLACPSLRSLDKEQRVAVARAALSKHVQKITLAPEGKAYIASVEFDLLGTDAVAVSMVPGAWDVHSRPLVIPAVSFIFEVAA